jgi:hypothetical protein
MNYNNKIFSGWNTIHYITITVKIKEKNLKRNNRSLIVVSI